jgi:hypothetical protein
MHIVCVNTIFHGAAFQSTLAALTAPHEFIQYGDISIAISKLLETT